MTSQSRPGKGRFASKARIAIGLVMVGLLAPQVVQAAAATKSSTSAAPTLNEIRAMWGGGAWIPDRFKMGSWFSGFKTLQEYTDPDFVPPNPVPLDAETTKVYRNIRIELGKGHQIFGPYAQCHPAGMPYRLSLGWYTVTVTQAEIDFLYNDLNYRRIFMDGRKHPDPKTTASTYYGHSVGHWEGKTLVIDTVNIKGQNTQIEPHIPKVEGAHVVERYTPAGRGVMDVSFTMTSPQLTKPWTVTFKVLRKPETDIVEDVCTDGNRYQMLPGGGLTMFGPDGKPLEKAED